MKIGDEVCWLHRNGQLLKGRIIGFANKHQSFAILIPKNTPKCRIHGVMQDHRERWLVEVIKNNQRHYYMPFWKSVQRIANEN